jgi:hypothetical protein
MTIRPATRQGVKPLIGLYSESGCGKTMSGLLLARGMAGPSGKIVMIDTESGRGSLYADVIPGGYDVLELTEPFSPDRYAEAIRTAEASGAAVIVVDSMTHEWESMGGVTDMAASIARGRADKYNREWDGVVQFGDWKLPKMEHAKFMAKLLQSRCPMVLCVRAKYKSRQVKGTEDMAEAGVIQRSQIGKSVIVKDEFTTPVQAEDFIYEMTAHAEILKDHSINLTKCSHPALRDCFPKEGPITVQTGEKVAQWCQAGITKTNERKVDPLAECKRVLWAACKDAFGAKVTVPQAEQLLAGWTVIPKGSRLADLTTVEQYQDAIDKLAIVATERKAAA